MTIAVYSHFSEKQKLMDIKNLISKIQCFNIEVILSDTLANKFAKHRIIDIVNFRVFTKGTLPSNTSFVISMGGDGTLLETVLFVKDKKIPILGVNTGRLGFLTAVNFKMLDNVLNLFWKGLYTIDYRTLLQIETSKPVFGDYNFALNEFTILRNETSSTIVVHAYLDGHYLNSYLGDGMLVSTSTGSTAYSLSVGGPLAMPHLKSFIIAPVCSHNLNVRPIIVSESSVIELKVVGANTNYSFSLDSRTKKVEKDVYIKIKKSNFRIGLLRFPEDNFLETLRNKLNWGVDLRNYIFEDE